MSEQKLIELELEFLSLVGFDLSKGYWQEDIDHYRWRYPWLWNNLVKLKLKVV